MVVSVVGARELVTDFSPLCAGLGEPQVAGLSLLWAVSHSAAYAPKPLGDLERIGCLCLPP
jgi:hypothetical protein